MNRHQRRLKQNRRQERIDRADKFEAANLAVNLMLVIPCYVLREQFGFGNKRMEKYITEFHRLYQAVVKDKVKISTLADSVEHDTGIRIADDGEIWNVRK